MQSAVELNNTIVIDDNTLMNLRANPSVESKQSVHKYSKSQIGNSPYINLTLSVGKEHHVIKQDKLAKYNDFLKMIQTNYFPESINENQLILAQEWNTIIPQSIDQTIQDAAFGFNLSQSFTVWKLSDFLLKLVNCLHESQEMNQEQKKQIKKLQDQIATDKQVKYKDKCVELEQLYNKQIEEYRILEFNYHEYLNSIENNQVIKESSKIVNFQKLYIRRLLEDKDKAEKQCQKYQEQFEQQEQQIERKQGQITQLRKEKENLYNSVIQFQKQQSQIDQHKLQGRIQSLQQLQEYSTQTDITEQYNQDQQKQEIQNHISNNQLSSVLSQQQKQTSIRLKQIENNTQQQESSNIMISTASIDMNKLNEVQQSQYELKQSNQYKSELITKLSICSYCKISCSQYVLLPCLHTYHIDCLEEIGKKACMDQQPQAKCMCSKIISNKMFRKVTQQILFQLQVATIFQKYVISHSLRKCKNCEFFFSFNEKENQEAYCPNCII